MSYYFYKLVTFTNVWKLAAFKTLQYPGVPQSERKPCYMMIMKWLVRLCDNNYLFLLWDWLTLLKVIAFYVKVLWIPLNNVCNKKIWKVILSILFAKIIQEKESFFWVHPRSFDSDPSQMTISMYFGMMDYFLIWLECGIRLLGQRNMNEE